MTTKMKTTTKYYQHSQSTASTKLQKTEQLEQSGTCPAFGPENIDNSTTF